MNTRQKRNVSIKEGTVYTTTSYGDVLVLKVEAYKKILIKFLNTGNEQIVAGGSLLTGQITDRKLFEETKLIYVGKIFNTQTFGSVEVVAVDNQKCTVKFLNTGNIQVVEAGNLRRGLIKDRKYVDENCEYKVGTLHKTKSFGEVEVVEIIDSHNIIVKFLNTGNTYKVSGGNLKKGNVSDNKHYEDTYPYKVGDILASNNYGNFTILEFIAGRKDKIKVKFEDTGAVVVTTLSQAAVGTVKDPESNVFTPKELGSNRFCVYLHKDKTGVVRYVGQGLYKRAKAILGRNKKWNEIFKDTPPIVEYVKTNISKTEAEELEQELIAAHSDTIVNMVKTYSRAREMDYELFNKYFYISEDSNSGLKFKIDYNTHKAGDDAYDNLSKGYYVVYLNRVNYLVHRVIWLLAHKTISSSMVVDHKNRNRGDNKLSNLSLVSMSHNMRNRTLPLPSSGYRNISMKVSHTGVISFVVNYTKPLHDSRDKETFSTVNCPDSVTAFLEAYKKRDELIAKGILLDVIKNGERPIEDMKNYLLSLNKEKT